MSDATTTRDLTFVDVGTVPAGTPCRYLRVDQLDPHGRRLAKRISDVPRSGMVLVELAGLGRWVPQDALSSWRPLRASQGGRAYQRPGHGHDAPDWGP